MFRNMFTVIRVDAVSAEHVGGYVRVGLEVLLVRVSVCVEVGVWFRIHVIIWIML